MDPSCFILGCLLMLQMTTVLVLLNPINDVRKSTKTMNDIARYYKFYYYLAVSLYFGIIGYLGIFIPLQKVHGLIINTELNDYEKLLALHQIEKCYFIAGFSLFMFVVLYGIRALLMYAATLLQLSIASSQPVVARPSTKEQKNSQTMYSPENILPNLLRVKRSVSYETILFAKELREQLRTIFKSVENRNRSVNNSTSDHSQNNLTAVCCN